MSNTFTLDSHAITALPRAPSVTFTMDAVNVVTAEPSDGYRIELAPGTIDDEHHCRIRVWRQDELRHDAVHRHLMPPSLDGAWDNPLVCFAEVATALYWSMWRRDRVREIEVVQPNETPSETGGGR